MKKVSLLFISLLSGALLISFGTSSVDASTVYSGTPKAIRGHYRTKMKKTRIRGHNYWRYKSLRIKGKTIDGDYGTGTDSYFIYKLKHINVKKNVFTVVGNYEPMGGESPQYTAIFVKSKSTLKLYYVNDAGTKITAKETYYKFSGKASRVTNYPYK